MLLERDLLDAARTGDEAAFRRLVAPYHGDLHAHCYRMLGSVHDAEDALQDALFRAWRGLPAVDGRATLRPWLYRIATNACLDAIERRRRRVIPIDLGPRADSGQPATDETVVTPIWMEPYPDDEDGLPAGRHSPEARYERREAVELAFVAALQHLSGRQRAVLILREVLGFSAKEVATTLDTTPASVNSALQRARRTVDERLPARSQQEALRALGDDEIRDLVRRFTDAFESGEVASILDLLTVDVTFAMPPFPGSARGRDEVAESWLMPQNSPTGLRYARATANGQIALGCYSRVAADRYLPIALDVLTLEGDLISSVTAFRMPELFPRFGLPTEL
jgi:RNA polymerase sigma-70 factor (ECF subfamily)